jgi:hypothetical protein
MIGAIRRKEPMTLRMPLSAAPGPQARLSALDYEVAQQKAETLGRIGQQVEQALEQLRSLQASGELSPELRAQRSALLDKAADRVWAMMVQREICGLRHWDAAVKQYAIPREVLNRMGRIGKEGQGR